MPKSRMKIGLYLPAQPPLSDLRRFVYAARVLRLNMISIWDHFQDFFPQALWKPEFTWLAENSPTPHQWYDYQTLLGYLASRAGRMQLAVGVTEPVRRHPVTIAQAALTLSHMTKRAPILGLGAGERENTEPYGFQLDRPVGRLEEAVQIIRKCFTSQGPFDFEGTHFQLNQALMDLRPVPRRTPRIWLAAHGPRMLRMTGTYADGWIPTIAFPDEYAEKLSVISDTAQAADRDPNQITPANQISVVVARTEREARAMLDHPAIRYMCLVMPAPAWRRIGAEHPFGDDFRGYIDIVPESYSREKLEDALARTTHEVAAGLTVWGTPEQVTARLREFADAGMRQAILMLGSTLVSQKAALYSLRAMWSIRRALS